MLTVMGDTAMDVFSDRGSIPLWSTICAKEGPGLPGGCLSAYANAHPNWFGFGCVCSLEEMQFLHLFFCHICLHD